LGGDSSIEAIIVAVEKGRCSGQTLLSSWRRRFLKSSTVGGTSKWSMKLHMFANIF